MSTKKNEYSDTGHEFLAACIPAELKQSVRQVKLGANFVERETKVHLETRPDCKANGMRSSLLEILKQTL